MADQASQGALERVCDETMAEQAQRLYDEWCSGNTKAGGEAISALLLSASVVAELVEALRAWYDQAAGCECALCAQTRAALSRYAALSGKKEG